MALYKNEIIKNFFNDLIKNEKINPNKITKNFCKAFFEKFFIIFKNYLKNEQTIEIRGIGTFKTITTVRRIQNFKTKTWRVEEKKKVKFKRAKNLNI